MKKRISTILAVLLFSIMFLNSYKVEVFAKNITTKKCSSESAVDLRINQRKLWQDHVLWTRSFIVSNIAELEDKDKVLERLLRNQDEIGASIKPYYGEEASNKLASLLREHISLAGQVVDAAKSSNKEDLDKYNKLWYENADQIVNALSSLNPKWSKKELKDFMYKHLQFITDQTVARLNKDWKADIDAYDKGQDHMLKFADVISKGIIEQFPDKFK